MSSDHECSDCGHHHDEHQTRCRECRCGECSCGASWHWRQTMSDRQEWRVFKYAGILKKINNMLNRAELLRGRR